MDLFFHPFSSYSQKALMAFYEKNIEFNSMVLDGGEEITQKFNEIWPIGRFPILMDDGNFIFEATAIIEYLEVKFPQTTQLIPQDAFAAQEARMWDRFFDNYVMSPMQHLVDTALGREADNHDRWVLALEKAYKIIDDRMKKRQWACGNDFTIADCAAAPSLLYADWAHQISNEYPNLHAYRQRLLKRPSYARAFDNARAFRNYFPLGAPTDRDL